MKNLKYIIAFIVILALLGAGVWLLWALVQFFCEAIFWLINVAI